MCTEITYVGVQKILISIHLKENKNLTIQKFHYNSKNSIFQFKMRPLKINIFNLITFNCLFIY